MKLIVLIFAILIIAVYSHGHHEEEEQNSGPLLSLLNITKDKTKLAFSSVFIVSMPSIPTFLLLSLVTKFNQLLFFAQFSKMFGGNKKKNDQLINESLISKLIAFSFGSLIGDVFLHMLPHLLEGHIHETHQAEHGHEPHPPEHVHDFKELRFYFYILFGILFFIIFDYLSIRMYIEDDKKVQEGKEVKEVKEVKEHSHNHNKQTSEEKSQVLVFLFGDFLHNFTDGIAIGASYSFNLKIGLSTTLAILMHETPHEIGDFAYLIKKKYSLLGILGTQVMTSIGCLIGAYVGLYYGEIYKEELLSLTAGGFLYMCLSNIFPEIRDSFRENKGSLVHFLLTLFFIISGVMIMYLVTLIE